MKKALLSGLIAIAAASGNLHAQCTPVATLDQNFENFTEFPDSCWYGSGTPGVNFSLLDDNSNNVVRFYGMFSVNTPFYLVTPELSTIDGNHYMTFDAVPNSGLALGVKVEVGTLDAPTNYASFVAHGPEIIINDTVSSYRSINIPANSSYKHIAFRITTISQHQAVKFDNFKWELDPPPVQCNPVSAINQSFDNFTAFPDSCWTTSAGTPNFYLNDTAADKDITFYSMSSVNTPFYLTTPELSTIDGEHHLKFKAAPLGVPGDIKIQVGTLAANDDYSSFTAHGNEIVINGGAEQEYTSIKIPANSNFKYVSLKITATAAHQALLLDDFVWEAAPGTGISDANNIIARLYPNPVSGDVITVEAGTNIRTATIYSVTGKVVRTIDQQPGATVTLPVGDLTAGMYIVQVITDNGSSTAKFTKQ
ncbi:MAG: hypothetical protein BGO09_02500 [Bacteroidetes bacterium 47-18]|nr:MAG: hypothetical protein BGO09_02500 [Bacteroidetes bacterium 47-18]